MRAARAAGLALALAAAPPVLADTDFTALTPAQKAIFHAEIRAVLLGVPQLLPDAPPMVKEHPYAGEVADDLARIAAHERRLFPDGARLALLVTADCPDCVRAEQELIAISKAYGVTFTRLDARDHADLAAALGLEQMPAYVFADRLFQGWMPAPVLERYLTE